MHEAGHALGLSDVDSTWIYAVDALPFINLTERIYKVSHPTIPDSVMNYDHRVLENYDPDANEGDRWKRHEPDCYPQPFGIMALWALYQTVDSTP